MMVSLADVIAHVSALPELASWPEMTDIFERSVTGRSVKWEFPVLACKAVGGEPAVASIGAAAVACMQCGLVLVDDILDDDPRGEHHRLGTGIAANMAFAFQAAAFRLIDRAPVEDQIRAAVYASLARMALTIAYGQGLDVQNLQGEESYWEVVSTKSAPFFGEALRMGALLGRAPYEVAEQLCRYGALTGEAIQVFDDLFDALQSPAGPDWRQGRNNVAILYAMTADHAERGRFESLLPSVDEPHVLEAAQRILIRCGAVSYCVYLIFERHQVARQLLDEMQLADSTPLRSLLTRHEKPLLTLLNDAGADVPPGFGGPM